MRREARQLDGFGQVICRTDNGQMGWGECLIEVRPIEWDHGFRSSSLAVWWKDDGPAYSQGLPCVTTS